MQREGGPREGWVWTLESLEFALGRPSHMGRSGCYVRSLSSVSYASGGLLVPPPAVGTRYSYVQWPSFGPKTSPKNRKETSQAKSRIVHIIVQQMFRRGKAPAAAPAAAATALTTSVPSKVDATASNNRGPLLGLTYAVSRSDLRTALRLAYTSDTLSLDQLTGLLSNKSLGMSAGSVSTVVEQVYQAYGSSFTVEQLVCLLVPVKQVLTFDDLSEAEVALLRSSTRLDSEPDAFRLTSLAFCRTSVMIVPTPTRAAPQSSSHSNQPRARSRRASSTG